MVVFPFSYDHWKLRYLTKFEWRSTESDKNDGISPINSASSGRRRMGILPFELARQDESNGGIPILLQLLDADIFDETSNGVVSKVLKHRFDDILPINSASSGRRRMGIPPFDSSQRAGLNGGILVLLQSLDVNGI